MLKLLVFLSLVGLLVFQGTALPSKAKDKLDETLDEAEDFKIWQGRFGQKFSLAELLFRKLIFVEHRKKVKEHNHKSKKSFEMGLTKFASLSDDEFKTTFLTARAAAIDDLSIEVNYKPTIPQVARKGRNLQSANGIDWVALGKVSPVKDQGYCGSCYTFSTTSGIQTALLMNNQPLVTLSEQQLVDCSKQGNNQGCQSGWYWYSYLHAYNHGLQLDTNYGYLGYENWCNSQRDQGPYKWTSYRAPTTCAGLLNDIYYRPMSVAVNADNWALYQDGIFDDCSEIYQVNHAVFLVGVDSQNNWKIKNSWGSDWGQNGYIWLKAGDNCAICKEYGLAVYI